MFVPLPALDDRRADVIEYVRQKYGREAVAQIITFGTMGAKSVVRDVGRVMGLSYGECDRLAKMIHRVLDRLNPVAMAEEALGCDRSVGMRVSREAGRQVPGTNC